MLILDIMVGLTCTVGSDGSKYRDNVFCYIDFTLLVNAC